MKKLFNILTLFLGITLSFAQQYPVRLIPVVIPPYSLKLGDYATSTDNKLQLQVLMTDLMEPQHQTGIKFSLQAGLNAVPFAQSNDFVVGMQPFMLYPGSNITLTNVDLRALFELQNLNGINANQYAQPLSDGVYQFCFQAYDFYTKNNLSQKTCATVFLTQYDPPMLNLPQNAEKVQAVSPYAGGAGIVFQWMPRQIAPNTKYIFTLKELWDLGQSPISGFLSSPPLWREETYAPTLFYGMDKTQLIAGKRYAWQVQAKSGNPVLDANPTEDNGVYRNNGLSEIFYFDYVENCALPTLLMAKNAGRGRVELFWNLAGQPSGLYTVQYRKRGSTSEWQTAQSYQPKYIVTGLEDQTEYEYRIGSVCGNLQTFNNTNPITDGDSAGNAYAFSGIQFFTTDANSTNNSYQCGVMPAVDIANKSPLQSLLGANEVFTAGDFPVTVISAQGSNGIYSGTGYIVVPYLEKAKVKVTFNNIKLNTDKKLIEGVVETTYDPTEKNVISIGDILNDLGNLFDGIVKIIDDAIGNGGMSQSDYDKLFGDIDSLIGKNNQDTSSLYDQGLVTPELKKEIEDLEQKIKDELKDLTCAVKDDKKKGSDDIVEPDCTQKLKDLKADIDKLKALTEDKDKMRCIWNIAPNEDLKGKTFYFQEKTTNKVIHKLKEGDYPISFNTLGNVYTFKSKGEIYYPEVGTNKYTTKNVVKYYEFEAGSDIVKIDVDQNIKDKILIDGNSVTSQQDCSDSKEKGQGLISDDEIKDFYSQNLGSENTDCINRSIKRAKDIISLSITNAPLALYTGGIEYGICMTEEDKLQTSDPYLTKFSYGFVNEFFHTIDIEAMASGIAKIAAERLVKDIKCLTDKRSTKLSIIGPNQDQLQYMHECMGIMSQEDIKKYNQLISTAWQWAKKNYTNPYIHGKAVFFIGSLVVPVLGQAKALRAEKLLATVEKTELYTEDLVRLSKELEGKNVEEAITILSKENSGWNIFPKIKIKGPIDKDGWLMGKYVNGNLEVVGNTQVAQEWDYVVTINREVLVGRKHSWLSKGEDVIAAGTLKYNNGKLVDISNASGHYLPTIEEASNFLRIFKKSGISIDDATLTILKEDGTIYKQIRPNSNERSLFTN